MSTAVMNETQRGERLQLEVRRVVRASRQRIFAAWTTPEQFQKWFGPSNISVLHAEADAEEGGNYRIVTTACDTTSSEAQMRQSSVSGTYLKVVPNSLLRFTWRPEWNPTEESVVTVELCDVEGGTELILRHEGFTTEDSRNRHLQGWTGTLDKLAGYLEE
jgi:uncharacterized protein YndB with AHSA1/START domain